MDQVDSLLARARGQTGLIEFGDDGFMEGLRIFVRALDAEARLNEMGRAANDAQIIMLLSNRLQVEDWYRRHPEIDEQQIAAPLIGLGLPRTGSTALGILLGEDPSARSLRNWEAVWPCPPPQAATYNSDPRIALMEQSMDRRAKLFPRMKAMLPSTATSPTECQTIMALDFKSQLLHAFVHVPSYVEWLNHKASLVPTYGYVKRVLKLLQWRCPPTNWRLKNPSHIMFIDALNEVFPDARFVMTHRDIGAVAPSVADLYYELRKAYSGAVDMIALGDEIKTFLELGMRRMIAFRDSGHEHRFFDIYFAPFQKDPFPSLEALYAWMGETLSDVARENMKRWWYETPPEDRSYERTSPDKFGLDPAKLRARFGFYTSRFAPARAA